MMICGSLLEHGEIDDRYFLAQRRTAFANKALFSAFAWRGASRRPQVLSGIIHVLRNGLRWRDAPEVYGPHKTLYNRFIRWSRMGVFDRIFTELSSSDKTDTLMIDATHLKAHRTASSLKKGGPRRA